MFDEFRGRPGRKLLPSGERGEIAPEDTGSLAETKHEEKKEEKGYVYRERSSGSYYRAISLPSPVDPDSSNVSYKNGVLEIKMPKTEIKKKKPLKID